MSRLAETAALPLGLDLALQPALAWAQVLAGLAAGLAALAVALAIRRALAARPGGSYRAVARLFAVALCAVAILLLAPVAALVPPLRLPAALLMPAAAAVLGLVALRIVRLLPALVAGPGSEELRREMDRRQLAEAALREAHDALAREHGALERRVQERTADLTAANEELERFAYVASHDLRAPLRALMTVPDWLRETLLAKYGAVAPELEQDLAEMEVQSRRMDRLLTDLLTYARIGPLGAFRQVIAPEALVAEAAQLAGLPPGFAVEVAGPLPPVRCIPAEFALIMRNLISNAVKHHDRDSGRITVAGRIAGSDAVIVVADDGPGIERRFATRIFEMFSTLKPRDEVEGSGMGLAMVKKIMERAGGYVRLAGTEGERGAVFELSFPAVRPSEATGDEGSRRCSESSLRKTATSPSATSLESLPPGMRSTS